MPTHQTASFNTSNVNAVFHLAAIESTATYLLKPQMMALRDAGYVIRLGCKPTLDDFSSDLAIFRPVVVSFPRKLRPIAILLASVGIVRALRRERPAAVHLHTPAVAIPFRMIPRWLLPRGMKVIYTVHGYAHVWDERNLQNRLLERAEWLLAPKTDLMLFQSSEDLEQSLAHGYRAELRYLGNGVGDEWFSLPSPTRQPGRLRIMFVGRLIREKGILDLLDAVSVVDAIDLTIVGEQQPSDRGGVSREIDDFIEARGLSDRVRRVGQVHQPRLRELVAGIDVVVLPSYREGVPRSLIEAMAARRPIIGTDVRGCRELIQDGVNGYLVPQRRPDHLARALERLANASPDELAAMGAASRERALKYHQERDVFQRLAQSYNELGMTRLPSSGAN